MEKSTKKKWLWGIGVVVVLAAIGSMQEKKEGSESKTPQQTERVAEQPQEAERQAREQKEEAERQAREQKKEAERQAREQKEKAVEPKKEDSIFGTYEITDKVGCTIRLTLNEDGTATITGVKGEGITYYCSWRDFRDVDYGIQINYSDETPYINFEKGPSVWKHINLKDGWIYAGNDKAKANNPQWRLKATKIK